jgi:hypothetical protein
MRHGFLLTAAALALSFASAPAPAASEDSATIPPVSQRYLAAEAGNETPDFQKHVTPLLGKLGCNGRACHGSFQGRGGFRLSLFGYDFKTDHDELFGRIDPEVPADSLILQKATMQVQHDGGQRIEPGNIICSSAGSRQAHYLELKTHPLSSGSKSHPPKSCSLPRTSNRN